MGQPKWRSLLLGAGLLGSSADAQVLHVVSASSEIYNLAALQCFPPVEIHRVSPASFTTFADSALEGFYSCDPLSSVSTDVQQITKILSDSIYIHERVYADLAGGRSQAALTKSDASIVFRLDAGRRFTYALHGTVLSENPGGGTAISSVSLTRLGPGGGVVQSYRVQSGPGPPTWQRAGFEPRGNLEPGDYALEAHTSAAADHVSPGSPPQGRTDGELWMRLKLRDVTTDVAPSNWGFVKTLYR